MKTNLENISESSEKMAQFVYDVMLHVLEEGIETGSYFYADRESLDCSKKASIRKWLEQPCGKEG